MKKQISPKIVSLIFSILVICFAVAFYALAAACPETVEDEDGNTYNVVQIGSQCWMAENLNVGTRIDTCDCGSCTTDCDNSCSTRECLLNDQDDDNVLEKHCYDDDEANCTSRGGLYQWAEAMDLPYACNTNEIGVGDCSGSIDTPHQGICPIGWHIPTHDEWTDLERQVCADNGNDNCATTFPKDTSTMESLGTDEGDSLKTAEDCCGGSNCGTSGFEALLAGHRPIPFRNFWAWGTHSYFWSSTEAGQFSAWERTLYLRSLDDLCWGSDVDRGSATKTHGFSVRCLKDVPPPCEYHNVWGWAWSDNIGWISFSCQNCDADLDGNLDGGSCGSGSSVDYGVDICEEGDTRSICSGESAGTILGGAWSRGTDTEIGGVGWISFNRSETGAPPSDDPCPDGSCIARLDLDGTTCGEVGQVCGWARALAPKGDPNAGGWDGWIKLAGTVQGGGSYGVSLNSGPTPSEFEGWAWGGDDTDEEAVIGWVSFNCNNPETGNVCGASDYKVMTGISLNRSPEAAISCNPATCSVYDSEVLVLENNSTDPDGDDDIKKSEWSIDGMLKVTCISNPLCNFTPQAWGISVGGHTAELYVEDLAGDSDIATKAFQIKKDISAAFSCSLDNIVWEVCEDITPTEEETVYFRDESIASEGAVINSRVWEKDGSSFGGSVPNPATSTVFPSMDIKLIVGDTASRGASVIHTIGAKIALPTWKEIPPF